MLIDLLAYLTGTEATSTILRLRKTRTVQSVVIDPHSPGATLIKPLAEAGIEVTQPSALVSGASAHLLDRVLASPNVCAEDREPAGPVAGRGDRG